MSCHIWFALGVMSCHIWFTLEWNVLPHLVHAGECPVTFGSHWGEMSCQHLLVILRSQMKTFQTRGLEWHLARKYWSVSSLFCFFTVWIHHYLLTYLPIYLLIYLFTYLPIYLLIYLFIHVSIYLCTYLFTYLLICLPTYLFIYLFVYIIIYLSTFFNLFIYIFTYRPIYLPLPRDGWKAPILKRVQLKSQPSHTRAWHSKPLPIPLPWPCLLGTMAAFIIQ